MVLELFQMIKLELLRNGGGNAFESLIMLLLSEKLTVSGSGVDVEEDIDIKRLRDEILAQLSVKNQK